MLFQYKCTGVMVLPDLVFLGAVDLSVLSLAMLVGDSGLVVLIIVLGVVVELESDSFSTLPVSSLSYKSNNLFYIDIFSA